MFHWFLSSFPVVGTYIRGWLNKLRGKEHKYCYATNLHDHTPDPNHPWTILLNPENDPDFIELDDAEFSTFLSGASLPDLYEILATAQHCEDLDEIPMIEAEIQARNS